MTTAFFQLTLLLLLLLVKLSQLVVIRLPSYESENPEVCPDSKGFQKAQSILSAEFAEAMSGYHHSCDGEGWKRVYYLNMSEDNNNCPSEFFEEKLPFRLCRRTNKVSTCQGTLIDNGGKSYSSVCGRIKGFMGTYGYSFAGRRGGLDTSYVDGVSLTYGPAGSRKHIWTFVSALDSYNIGGYYCPQRFAEVPKYVKNEYFCDSGKVPKAKLNTYKIYDSNPLWDGLPCKGSAYIFDRCSTNNPPWFTKHLAEATTDDIELRICGNAAASVFSTLLQEVEIYIK